MNKVALITGASSGIGKELAIIHAKRGGDLVLVARREDNLIDIKLRLESRYGVDVTIVAMDLSIPNSATKLYNSIKTKGISVDYLINNAGFGLRGEFHNLSLQRQQEMIQLNMTSLTELTHLFLQDFTKRGSGKILNTSSTASLLPGPLQAIYFATKAYVTYFSNALAEELRGSGITVTNLMPGATETEFAKVSGMDKTEAFKTTVSAYSVAKDGYEGMMSGKLDIISGLTPAQKMMMYMIPFTPKSMVLKSVKKIQEV
jgi:short-subunit dehydrogenase